MESKVELFEQIRRDARVNGDSIRFLARKYRVARRTVRQALASAEPPRRKPPVRNAPQLGRFKPLIDSMLREDLSAPRKQRHTAQRIHDRLVDEHGGKLSYSTVRQYVKKRRPELEREAGASTADVFIPQEHPPGAEAEVDFGEVWVDLPGVRTKCYIFAFRLSYSGKAVHRVYPTQGQEAFLEGHLEAFATIGGVPTGHVRYDNLTAAVKQVLGTSRERVENDRWVLFRSHCGFDAFYCQPGVKGAHEKGGIEGEIGRFRRNRLTPVPVVDSLAELNARIIVWDEEDDRRRISGKLTTIGADYAHERALLNPLPTEVFDPGVVLTPRVDRSSLIRVGMVKYSVPVRFIGRAVRVSLRASEILVFDGRTLVARHARITARDGSCVDLDHYLEVLHHKPGAFPGSTALAQARASGKFTSAHDAFWAAAGRTDGDTQATRELIDVLLLHRSMAAADVSAGIEAALTVGAVTADVVAVEARRAAAERLTVERSQPMTAQEKPALVALRTAGERRVVSLTQRRLTDPAAVIAGLPPDTRPLPSVASYDELLTRRVPDPTRSPSSNPSTDQQRTGTTI
ncbi:transposase [Arthrobacter sp. Leaf234]|uniref:IS21 family transposase n=1 Tax=Arthrobacter sp. Leaf234 TaxID=1736303 RepID=UPI0006F3812C|nr:IS21 family transposase [Arthrobacter sp. Leaf234]KQO02145.1 transposase [Arthrobacter sp. Leaf234]